MSISLAESLFLWHNFQFDLLALNRLAIIFKSSNMIEFNKFKEIVEELNTWGKLEFFLDKDENGRGCLTCYLYCSEVDGDRLKLLEKLNPEYWNVIPYKDNLQIYLSLINVNRNLAEINNWLATNLGLNIDFGKDRKE